MHEVTVYAQALETLNFLLNDNEGTLARAIASMFYTIVQT